MQKLKNLFFHLRKSKDGKVLAENFAYLSLLQVASYIFPFITMPYLAKVIGVTGFGKIAFASAVIIWIQTVADWGFNLTATRDVAKIRDNKNKVSTIFSNVFWAKCLLMFVSFIFLLFLIAIIPKFRDNFAILMVSFLLVPGHIMFPDWFFQAIEKMKYTTILNVLSKLFFTIAIFIFINKPEDYILQPLLTSCGFVLSGIIAMYLILKKWNYKLHRPNFKVALQTIKGSTNVFIQNIFPNLYNSLGVVLLGFFWGERANGILDAGRKFPTACIQLMSVVSRTFFPFLSRRIDKHKTYAKLSLLTSAGLAVILFISAPILIKLFFNENFSNAIIITRIFSITVILHTMTSVYGVGYMIVEGYDKQLRNITALVSVVAFIVSIPLIYFYSNVGAAITNVIALIGLGCIPMIFVKQFQKKQNK